MTKNIHDDDELVKVHCGGTFWNQYAVSELCDKLKHLPLPQGPIYITKDGIEIWISLGQLAKHYQKTLDTNIENKFYVYNKDRSYIKFECRNDGLYCLDVDNGSGHTNFLTTVKNQKELFSNLDVKRAILARYIQECSCLPSNEDFSNGLETRGIKEYGVGHKHINIVSGIYGLSKHAVEGKSVQKTNKMSQDSTTTNLPPSILQKYGKIRLGVDVLHINRVPYMFSTAKHIKFMQCLCIRDKTLKIYIKTIKQTKSLYVLGDFKLKRCTRIGHLNHAKQNWQR